MAEMRTVPVEPTEEMLDAAESIVSLGPMDSSHVDDRVVRDKAWHMANLDNPADQGCEFAVQGRRTGPARIYRAMLAAAPQAPAGGWQQEIALLRTALRFYARGQHYHLDEREEFDTVSGEPQNWLCSGLEESATMVEDGRVALFALQGIDSNWRDGDDDNTPLPVEGEVSCSPLPEPPKERA